MRSKTRRDAADAPPPENHPRPSTQAKMSIRVGINGFGRIGRLVMRAAQTNPNISIAGVRVEIKFTPSTRRCNLPHRLISTQVGVNDPFIPVDYMRYMLKYDTVHGRFPNTVEVAGDSIAVGGDKVKVFGERDPSRAVWKSTSELGRPKFDFRTGRTSTGAPAARTTSSSRRASSRRPRPPRPTSRAARRRSSSRPPRPTRPCSSAA